MFKIITVIIMKNSKFANMQRLKRPQAIAEHWNNFFKTQIFYFENLIFCFFFVFSFFVLFLQQETRYLRHAYHQRQLIASCKYQSWQQNYYLKAKFKLCIEIVRVCVHSVMKLMSSSFRLSREYSHDACVVVSTYEQMCRHSVWPCCCCYCCTCSCCCFNSISFNFGAVFMYICV